MVNISRYNSMRNLQTPPAFGRRGVFCRSVFDHLAFDWAVMTPGAVLDSGSVTSNRDMVVQDGAQDNIGYRKRSLIDP
jgi:hypothetical protein